LNNINALFPEEYRVRIITHAEYKKALQDNVYYICNFCTELREGENHETPTEVASSHVHFEEQKNGLIVEVLSKSKTTQIWKCPKCRSINNVSNTKVIKERSEEPFYHKVVPPCPVKLSGLSNRLGFHQKFSAWFYKYLEELEYELGLYRIEYAAQAESEEQIEYAPDEE
jgi:hypothetical protein